MAEVDSGKLLTLTWDLGSETARHDEVARLFSEGVYFADPGCPWMRGTNENTNGLVRQYLRKGMDLRAFSAVDLAATETRLNDRPGRIRWRHKADSGRNGDADRCGRPRARYTLLITDVVTDTVVA